MEYVYERRIHGVIVRIERLLVITDQKSTGTVDQQYGMRGAKAIPGESKEPLLDLRHRRNVALAILNEKDYRLLSQDGSR